MNTVQKSLLSSVVLLAFSQAAHAQQLNIFPNDVNFGPTQVGLTQSQTVSVINESNQNIMNLETYVYGDESDYQVNSMGCWNLMPHGECSITITFEPRVAGNSQLSVQVGNMGVSNEISVNGTAVEASHSEN